MECVSVCLVLMSCGFYNTDTILIQTMIHVFRGFCKTLPYFLWNVTKWNATNKRDTRTKQTETHSINSTGLAMTLNNTSRRAYHCCGWDEIKKYFCFQNSSMHVYINVSSTDVALCQKTVEFLVHTSSHGCLNKRGP